MATTTNYGWTTPDDTALVKDGASAIRTLGSSVDTTTKNLNPETTLGDLAYRSSTANVKTRLGLGTAGQVLTVNSGANAPEWATLANTFVGTNVSKSANQSISTSTATAVTWDVEAFDTDAIHSTATNTSRFTIPTGKGGYWQISPVINWADQSASGVRQLKIYKNGTQVKSSHFYPTSAATMVATFAYLIMPFFKSSFLLRQS